MTPAPSASGSGRRLLPIVLIAMILPVAVFIVLTASTRAGAAPAPCKALYVPMHKNAFDQRELAAEIMAVGNAGERAFIESEQ